MLLMPQRLGIDNATGHMLLLQQWLPTYTAAPPTPYKQCIIQSRVEAVAPGTVPAQPLMALCHWLC